MPLLKTSLDIVRVDRERQLDCTRKRAVSALATLPIGILR
jgi:hypothetical protein